LKYTTAKKSASDNLLELFQEKMLEMVGEDEDVEYNVAVCNICDKPRYGRLDPEERCQCDISGEYIAKTMMCDDTPQNTLRAEIRERIKQIAG